MTMTKKSTIGNMFSRKILVALLTCTLVFGALPGFQLTAWATDSGEINLSTVPNNDLINDDWTFNRATNVYTILDGANVTVTGTSRDQRRIEVDANATVTITLDDADIGTSNELGSNQAAISLGSNANVTLMLTNSNFVTGGQYKAGIGTTGATLTINGSGSLTATGGDSSAGSSSGGAGIGGGGYEAGGNIIINDGTIMAQGGGRIGNMGGAGAGIGGGGFGAGGNIIINGGTVTAQGSAGGAQSAGIGGGGLGAGGNITINGGTVTATKGMDSDKGDIGPGRFGGSGKVTITGGSVKCTSETKIVGTLTNGSSENVYLATLTLDGAGDDISVEAAKYQTYMAVSYGVNDVITRDSGVIYAWLPDSSREVTVQTNSVKYSNTNVTVTTDNTFAAMLTSGNAETLYTLTYNNNGADRGTVPPVTKYFDGAWVTVSGNTGGLAKTGYVFGGWTSSEVNGSPDGIQSGYTFNISRNVTFTAKWNAKIVSVETQSGTPVYGQSGSAAYRINTEYIDGGSPAVTLGGSVPVGLTASASIISSSDTGAGMLYIDTTAATPPGTYNITATIDGATSDEFTLTVAQKTLTWNTDGTVQSKDYDGTNAAVVANEPTLNGIINNDNVTVSAGSVTFDDANTGTDKTVTASDWGITGTDKYSISDQPTFANGTITQKATTVKKLPTASNIYKGEALSMSTLTGGTASVPGSFKWTTGTAIIATAGTQPQQVTFTPTDETNYSKVTANVSVTAIEEPAKEPVKEPTEEDVKEPDKKPAKSIKQHKITFDTNGGKFAEGAKKSKTVTQGKKYGKLPKVKRVHYKFEGWYTRQSGGKEISVATKVTVKKNQTLYAHWKKQYKYAGLKANIAVLSIRNQPRTGSDVIGYLTRKNTLRIIGKVDHKGTSSDWYKVKYKDKTGYIYASFVQTEWK